MRRFITRTVIALIITCICLAAPRSASLCGKERWPVKVAKDGHVEFLYKNQSIAGGKLKKFKKTTIAKLIDEPYPFNNIKAFLPKWSYYNRVYPVETNIWVVEATLTHYNAQNDEDYHLVLEDASGNTLIAEIPSLNCIQKTPQPLRDMIKQARADFDARYTAPMTPTFGNANVKVRVTGVGMFDRNHKQRGVAPNAIELHPVIKIEFL